MLGSTITTVKVVPGFSAPGLYSAGWKKIAEFFNHYAMHVHMYTDKTT